MQPTDTLFQAGPLTDVATQLSAMRQRHEDRFQPASFFRLERLYQRAEQSAPGVQKALAQRLSVLIEQYQQQLNQAQTRYQDTRQALHGTTADTNNSNSNSNNATNIADTIEDEPPAGNYNELTRQLNTQLAAHTRQQKARHSVRTLRHELSAPALDELPVDSAQALDDEMLAMEHAAQRADQMELPIGNDHPQRHRQELKAVRRYRQLAAQQKTESMVNRAVITRPENPGPLNPHMLAIKSLTNMRDLSLPYLNRFVSYLETVMWLEEQLELDTNAGGDKKDAAKAGKKKTKTGRK
ncbi:DUF2894 domain-containing protein [Halioxenophilus aromaticivorans]|uniref:DUF2894 domain-containing protein n=1 Tax=Halioxenophilus aromaticivorans TaxID=1306992 RepID=A0AAV3TZ99_9ALTE